MDEEPRGFVMVPRALAYDARLSASARMVWVILYGHVKPGGAAWPGMERLTELTGLSGPTVYRALAELKAAGLITPERVGPKPVRYHVHLSPVRGEEGARPLTGEKKTSHRREKDLSPVRKNGTHTLLERDLRNETKEREDDARARARLEADAQAWEDAKNGRLRPQDDESDWCRVHLQSYPYHFGCPKCRRDRIKAERAAAGLPYP